MNRTALYFSGPGEVSLREEPLPRPGEGQVLVQSLLTAVSHGTELLIYRGQAPADLPADETIAALAGDFRFPVKYGYAAVGRVIGTGAESDTSLEGKLVFAFQPHESHFVASPDQLIVLPEGVSEEDAVFLANMETAVTLLLDGRPLIGERVAVFGQGIVGLLTAALLAQCPLECLVTLDCHFLRRQASLRLGADASLDPTTADAVEQVRSLLSRAHGNHGADLTYELSGVPTALGQAIAVTGFDGRVVIGSWYGRRRSDSDLGGWFHRSRIRLISSQVSTLAPALTGRWTKNRRRRTALQMLQRVRPSQWVTHRFPIARAAHAYRLIDRDPGKTIQVVFTY